MKLYCFLIVMVFLSITYSCNNQKQNEKKVLNELEQGETNTKEFSEVFKNKDVLLKTQNSNELLEIASEIYTHIGIPFSQEDTQRLNIAIEFLDKASRLDTLNKEIYRNKVDIYAAMQKWDEAIVSINKWINNGTPTYYDYMLKGFIFEKMNEKDSSRISFEKALSSFNQNELNSDDIRNEVQQAIILSFLYGKDAGLKKINQIIDETGSNYALFIKDTVIENFDKLQYINSQIFKSAEKLEPVKE